MLADVWAFLTLGAGVAGYNFYKDYMAKKRLFNTQIYLLLIGFNPKVQSELECSIHKDLEKRLGREFGFGDKDREDAIREIMENDGWRYLDICTAEEIRRTDPYFRYNAGLPTRPGDVTFKEYQELHPVVLSPEEIERNKRKKKRDILVFSAIVFIILFSFFLWKTWPPMPHVYIGMSYSSWCNHHEERPGVSLFSKSGKKFIAITIEEEQFGCNTVSTYLFNERNRLECVAMDFEDSLANAGRSDENLSKRFGYEFELDADRDLYYNKRRGLNYEVIYYSLFYDGEWHDDNEIVCVQRRGNGRTDLDYMRIVNNN